MGLFKLILLQFPILMEFNSILMQAFLPYKFVYVMKLNMQKSVMVLV